MNPMMAVSNPSMAMTRKHRNSSRFCSDERGWASIELPGRRRRGAASVFATIVLGVIGHVPDGAATFGAHLLNLGIDAAMRTRLSTAPGLRPVRGARTRRGARARQRRPGRGWRPASSTRWRRSDCPAVGYGIRYEYGMFAQDIVDGRQVEHPDPWLRRRHAVGVSASATSRVPVRFGGWVEPRRRRRRRARWVPGRRGPGQGLRHGRSRARHRQRAARCGCGRPRAPAHIDLHAFNRGDYARAAEVKNEFENISWVLYPNDSTPAGRELRLRQEYFFVARSLQDILRAPRGEHGTLDKLPTRSRSTSTTRIRRSASPS